MESLFNVVEIAAIAEAIAIRDHINKKVKKIFQIVIS